TFGYMAPEQFQGRALPVSDVYAAGATALALLTGTEPENLPHRGLAIDVPAALGVSAKDPLAVALGQMLDPNPDTRAKAIGPLLAGLGGEAAGPGRDPRRAKAEPKRGGGSRRERRHQQRDERRAARREARAVAREARQMARHARRRGARSGELPPIVHLLWALARPFIVVMAAVARVAVSVATQVVVPTLFTLLSLLFGRGMREAGRTVSRAGRVADDGICWLRDFLLGRLPVDSEATGSSEAEGKARIDVADEEAGEGLRVDPRDATEEAAAELESALDEAAEELEAIVRRRRPPPDDPPGAS
ncbi:MAG: serine/threonine protein kinase, partial [Myxococcales bacterium]|nr:serine/threonine protein kinase [Myxococcales bacterium]